MTEPTLDTAYQLDDKYTRQEGRVYLTGTQALIRLMLMQRQRDANAGLNTAGYVSGYRGSPLGNVDREFWRAERLLSPQDIKFQAGVNEDLAATAIWGTQQAALRSPDDATHDGVFAMWYGKGPGVDRTGDVFRHANMAGTAPHGGVLVLAGDDPACKSSTVPSQSEHAFMDANIPIFNPSNIQDILDYGIYGWAMSRYSGLWVGMKTITETVETSASVDVAEERVQINIPTDFDMPEGGLHIRWPDPALDQEERLQRHKVYAALAFARANALDKVTIDSPTARLGIVSTGKSYLDVLQALEDLGLSETDAADLGIRVYKVAMSWPLEREGIRAFAEGLDEILVVEEKRAVIENQLKEQLYNWKEDVRPRVVGKFDEDNDWVLPSAGELTPARVARVIAKRLSRYVTSDAIEQRLAFLSEKEKALAVARPNIDRIPYFCSGCPHNSSTKVPEGSHAAAGIGCHFMATWMNRKTETFTHMGGEGANWIGQSAFVKTKHLFVNIGDGTYFHSGLLAIRAAVASGVNITYKILYNDAVAMTGGQPHDGELDVATITRQVRSEGVKRIAVVTDEPHKYPVGIAFADGVTVHDRHELDDIQRQFRDICGTTAIVYDQTCAAEKRRRRKRGLMEDPARFAFINEAVCEGCGDCGTQSNCVSITAVETELGRKRAIDQSTCNKDYTCVDGFCPSFVTVEGVQVKTRKPASNTDTPFAVLPEPTLADIETSYDIVITGIGGTGVITVGALIGMAAHLEDKGVTVLDMAGLAQKNGAVVSHVRIAANPDDINAVRVAAGNADLLLGCDLVTAGGSETLAKLRLGKSRAVVNAHETMTAAFTANPDLDFPLQGLQSAIEGATGKDASTFIDATALATTLLGNSLASNVFMIGFAWQKGLLPLSKDALVRAIELNGIAIDFNKRAFEWGRRAAHDTPAVERIASAETPAKSQPLDDSIDAFIDRRISDLVQYQDAAYGDKYRRLVERVRAVDKQTNAETLSWAVAKSYFKVLAYKDEYEVARLYSDGRFERTLAEKFEGTPKLTFHLAPPIISDVDPHSKRPVKKAYGRWMLSAFKVLAGLKKLRATPFDPFGYTADRKADRQHIADYEQTLDIVLNGLTPENMAVAAEIAALPLSVRGYGPVKQEAAYQAKRQLNALMKAFREASDKQTDAA